ncbi:MAG: hypothetical protein LBI67_00745 [Treponema sp.]|nr:hypothetical protein [Treponema sp.]
MILLAVSLAAVFYYFSFRSIGSKESFVISNLSGENFNLAVAASEKNPVFTLKKYRDVNGIRYVYIHKSDVSKIRGPVILFQCERDDSVDVVTKLKNVFDELTITDDRNTVIWDLNSAGGITSMEDTILTNTISHILLLGRTE